MERAPAPAAGSTPVGRSRTRTRLLTLALVVAGASLPVLLVRSAGGRRSQGTDPGRDAPGREVPGAAPRTSSLVAAWGERESDVSEATRAAVAVPAIEAPRSRWIRLVAAETGEPLPGARLEVVPRGWSGSAFGAWSSNSVNASRDFLRAFGAEPRDGVADEEGRVELQRPAGEAEPIELAGFAPGLYGRREFPSFDALPGTFELYPDAELVVRVVDAAGGPAPLARCGWRSTAAKEGPAGALVFAQDGEARLPHVGAALASRPEASFELLVAVPGRILSRPLEAADLHGPPLVVEVPACGSLLFEVVDALGRRRSDAEVFLREPEHPEIIWGTWLRDDGQLGLDRVAIGGELHLLARTSDGLEVEHGLPGPARAGEQVEARLVVGADRPRLRARVVDPLGIPLRRSELDLRVSADSAREIPIRLVTDVEGRFECLVGRPPEPGPSSRYDGTLLGPYRDPVGARLRVVCMDPREDLEAEVVLPSPLGPGLHDLGEVVLRRPEPLVEGRLVDEEGRPLEGWLDLRTRDGPLLLENVPTREDGSFALRVSTDGEDFVLTAARPDHLASSVPVRRGQTDVVVRLRRRTPGDVRR